jgi:peptidoglycan/LPS O-acetylase OafA/YrhL
MKKERFYEIDLLRFLAALSVMLYHYTFRGFAADDMSPLEFPYLAHVFKYGSLGVDLFFIISGFVILLTAYNRDAVSFTISRITRIYPAYWFSVCLTAAAIFLFGEGIFQVELTQLFANLTMIHGFFGVRHVDGVYWSLLVELKFYFIIFLLIVFKQLRHIRFYLYGWLALSFFNYFHPLSGALAFFLIFDWSAYFIAGAAFYLVRSDGPSLDKYALILLAYILSILHALAGIPGAAEQFNTDLSAPVLISVITCFYLIFLLISARKLHFANKPYFSILGALTYPLYLVHQNIGFIIFNHFSSETYKYLTLPLTIATSLLLAYLINKHIERRYSGSLKQLLNWLVATFPLLFKKQRLTQH